MAFPVATGFPQLTGIVSPTFWSPMLLVKFYAEALVSRISNTKYEGEIKGQGSEVIIRTTPDVQISPHAQGQGLVFQHLQPNIVSLKIDKGASWSFVTGRVDVVQANYDLAADWTSDASKQQKIYIDKQVFSTEYAKAAPGNRGNNAGVRTPGAYSFGETGAPVDLDSTNIMQYLVDAESALDEYDVPKEGRWFLMPPWACGMLKQSEVRDASLTGDSQSILRGDIYGMYANFTLYKSNLLASVTDGGSLVTHMMFGHPEAITFATQFEENAGPLVHPNFFGDYYRGLQIYGYETIKPEALGHFYARRAGT